MSRLYLGKSNLPLHPGQRDALDEVLLGEEEDDDDGEDHEEGSGHEHAGGYASFDIEGEQAQREWIEALVLKVNQRGHKLVPTGHEGEDRNRREGGLDQ